MIGKILKLGILLFIGIVAYNYFFGTEQEKEKSKEIIGKVSDIGKAGVGLIKEEYDKFKAGKYDDALDKIGNALNNAKDKGSELLDDINKWQARKESWEEEKEKLEQKLKGATDEEKAALRNDIKKINAQGEALETEGERLKEAVEQE